MRAIRAQPPQAVQADPPILNVMSLFAGIGGIELGLERTGGFRTVAQVEIDPFCQRVLAKHWPEVPRHDDVRTATEWWLGGKVANSRTEMDGRLDTNSNGGRRQEYTEFNSSSSAHTTDRNSRRTYANRLRYAPVSRPTIHVIAGGFPCQDISNAGKRKGIIEGSRSSLWSEMAWVVSQLRPRYVIMENVAAILGRGLDVVAGDLAEIGYDLEWDCVSAAAVGAPHRRDRWWGIAYPHSSDMEAGRQSWGTSEKVTWSDRSRADVAYPQREGSQGHGGERELGERRHQIKIGGRRTDARDVADTAGDGRGQRRPRRFIGSSAYRDAERAEALADADNSGRDGWPGPVGSQGWGQPANSCWWAAQSGLGQCSDGVPARLDGSDWERGIPRVARGVPDRVNRLKALGNTVVPQVAQHIGEVVLALEAERQGEMRGNGRELVS